MTILKRIVDVPNPDPFTVGAGNQFATVADAMREASLQAYVGHVEQQIVLPVGDYEMTKEDAESVPYDKGGYIHVKGTRIQPNPNFYQIPRFLRKSDGNFVDESIAPEKVLAGQAWCKSELENGKGTVVRVTSNNGLFRLAGDLGSFSEFSAVNETTIKSLAAVKFTQNGRRGVSKGSTYFDDIWGHGFGVFGSTDAGGGFEWGQKNFFSACDKVFQGQYSWNQLYSDNVDDNIFNIAAYCGTFMNAKGGGNSIYMPKTHTIGCYDHPVWMNGVSYANVTGSHFRDNLKNCYFEGLNHLESKRVRYAGTLDNACVLIRDCSGPLDFDDAMVYGSTKKSDIDIYGKGYVDGVIGPTPEIGSAVVPPMTRIRLLRSRPELGHSQIL